MCLLVVLWRMVEDAPLIVAANREEAYARGGAPPQVVTDPVRFVAGLDPQAGGTWLGVNQHGLLVAVTNRKKNHAPAAPRSRGLLVRDLLQLPSASEAAAQAIRELDKGPYAGCNFLCADVSSALVVQSGDWLRVRPLPTGVHVMATADLNNEADPRVAYALSWLESRRLPTSGDWIAALKELCGQTGDEHRPPMCLRGERSGTVSSSMVVLRRPPAPTTYLHAPGPPDKAPYEDVSALVQALRG